MTVTVTHTKVNQIPDFTQADIDAQIALGNYPPGTLLSDIALPSDWNDDHALVGIDVIESNLRDAAVIDMADDDYTMTASEAAAVIKIVINQGVGKTLTAATATDGVIPGENIFITLFTSAPFSFASQAGGSSVEIVAPFSDQIYYVSGSTPVSEYNSYVSDIGYDSGAWDGSLKAPTQNAMSDFIASTAERFCILTSDYTLTSTTAAQKMFNATANGALTLETGTYFFECQMKVSSMSATSGNLAWGLKGAGTATIGDVNWGAWGRDGGTVSAAAAIGGSFWEIADATGDILTPTVATNMWASISGAFQVTAAGTIIPSVALTTAAAAVMEEGSFFKCRRVGSSSVTTAGSWS